MKLKFLLYYISGCDSGFGHSLALNLDRQGFTVFAGCLFSDREGARSLKENSKNIHLVQLDVTDDWQVQKAVQTVKENLNGKGKSFGERNYVNSYLQISKSMEKKPSTNRLSSFAGNRIKSNLFFRGLMLM